MSKTKRARAAPVVVDLAQVLGARGETSQQMLSVYVPDRDKHSNETGTQRAWVLRLAALLAEMGGGVTILPAAEGGWLNEGEGKIVWEHPVVVYTYVKGTQFLQRLPALRQLLHAMGRETGQGEVVVEFDGFFLRIVEPYDEA